MASPEQITPVAVQELLADPALARNWDLDPSRSTVLLSNRSMWGLARVTGSFHQITGSATVSPAGEVTGDVTVAAACAATVRCDSTPRLTSTRLTSASPGT